MMIFLGSCLVINIAYVVYIYTVELSDVSEILKAKLLALDSYAIIRSQA